MFIICESTIKYNFLLLILSLVLLSNCTKKEKLNNPINANYCENLLTDTLGTNDSARVFMPNAFSPNGDAINDYIAPILINIVAIDFKIYDSSNNLVFSTNDVYGRWTPSIKSQTNNKYYYRIQAKTNNNHQIGLCGVFNSFFKCIPSNVSSKGLTFEDQYTASGLMYPTSEREPLTNCP